MAEHLAADAGTNGLRADEYRSIVREIIADEIEKNKAVGRIRAKLKRLKDAGANLDAVSMLRKLGKLDEDERILRLEALIKYAGWEGIKLFEPGVDPAAQQAELWDEGTPEIRQGHRDAVVHSDGWNTRKAGGARQDNPQVAGSSEYAKWDEGWLDCDRDLKVMADGKAATVASTERRPRAAKGNGAATDAANPELPPAKPKRAKKGAAEAAAAD
jgi:hypothetical protein